MSRDGRADARSDAREPAANRFARSDLTGRPPGIRLDRLSLPRSPERQPVQIQDRTYSLRESEARVLATVGAFRVVRADDLQTVRSSREAWTGDLRSLAEQGLIQLRTVEVNREPLSVAVLTRAGKEVLEGHRL